MPPAGPSVLVAEDDARLRSLLTEPLQQEFGAVVEVVPDGRSAVAALASGLLPGGASSEDLAYRLPYGSRLTRGGTPASSPETSAV